MKQLQRISLLFVTIAALNACTLKTTWNITEYGAVGDSATINTSAIQQAIDACNKAGGGTVIIKNGAYISGTILLKENVTLHIEEGAQLLGSDNPYDYQSIDAFVDATGQTRGKCLVGAADVKNVAIMGKGVINGRGELFQHGPIKKKLASLGVEGDEMKKQMGDRPFLVRLVRVDGVNVQGVHLRQSAAWTLHLYQCANVQVEGIDIYAHAQRNNDGIDLDSSHDVVIKNCNIDSGDDALCFKNTSPLPTYNVHASGNRLKSNWGAIKFGTEAMGDFNNILVEDCHIHDTKGGGIKMLSVDGANFDKVTLRNITMENVDMPIFVRLGERLRTYRDAPKQEVGNMKNVLFENIKATQRSLDSSRVNPPTGLFITGTPKHKIEQLTFKNIEITLPGGGTQAHRKNIVAEDETRYPEFLFFGVLPASGVYARHVKHLTIQGLKINRTANDARELYIYEDVENLITQ